jgi:hypothetical protein
VAYLLGLAAALDKYEHAPHDVRRLRRRAAVRSGFTVVVQHLRRGYRDERLEHVRNPQ